MSSRNRWWIAALTVALCALPTQGGAQTAWTADAAVRAALERNPDLAVLAAELDAAEARLQGGSRLVQTNPELDGAVGARTGPTGRALEIELGVSQRVELPGTRDARIEVLRAARDAAAALAAERRGQLAAEVRVAFLRALAVEALVGLAREHADLTRQILTATEKRVEAGDAARIELNAARIETGRAALELNAATQEAITALAALGLLVGADPADELHPSGDLAAPGVALGTPEHWVEQAMDLRADLQSARLDLALARAELRSAEVAWRPSPSVGARYAREERAQVVTGTVAIELPVFERNQAERGGAAAHVEAAARATEAAERRIRHEVQVATARLRAAREAVDHYELDVLRAADENLELIAAAHAAGRLESFRLVLARRDALFARRARIETLEALRAAEIEVARAIGALGTAHLPSGGADVLHR
jgi:cobalt-zinc-cadmium efflux system outer membrane protein